MGRVFLVERKSDAKRFALKALRSAASGAALARLAREAQIAAEVSHESLVSIVDIDVARSGWLFIVMELVEGASLAESSRRYGDRAWALSVLRQIATGLAALHARGIVHRDLKPANVLLTNVDSNEPTAKITDFGIASFLEGGALDDTISASGKSAGRSGDLTRTGVILGTPMYMAPELAAGSRHASPAADVFAFGIIAHQLLADDYPFNGMPISERLSGNPILRAESIARVATDLDPALAELIDASLAIDPSARPTSAALRDALRS
jgi:serine/threonine-protein kinase